MAKLPTKDEFMKTMDALTCNVCQELFGDNHVPVQLPYNHIFGDHCIVYWFKSENPKNNRCPLCNRELFEQENYDEDGDRIEWEDPEEAEDDNADEEDEEDEEEEEEEDVAEPEEEEVPASPMLVQRPRLSGRVRRPSTLEPRTQDSAGRPTLSEVMSGRAWGAARIAVGLNPEDEIESQATEQGQEDSPMIDAGEEFEGDDSERFEVDISSDSEDDETMEVDDDDMVSVWDTYGGSNEAETSDSEYSPSDGEVDTDDEDVRKGDRKSRPSKTCRQKSQV
ncbi:hypothetical protein EK21DRAFT_84160 [Setomelanomma holmii]|uniref:RING-type domain-containing protein n=1 Tax=Setomelanomma holmii TaxID=210430 RepID=A0A9P4HK56_9PLEO|nr:hypothetical protein EK21DRAFT_84160 [Setomelanomma holmii]